MEIRVDPDSIGCLCPLSIPDTSDSGALNHKLLIRDSLILPEQLPECQAVGVASSQETDAGRDSPEPLIDSLTSENAVSQSS